jgi:hypothetical protein
MPGGGTIYYAKSGTNGKLDKAYLVCNDCILVPSYQICAGPLR